MSNSINNKKNILFICGFNTFETNTYDSIFNEFKKYDQLSNSYNIVQYKTTYNLDDICYNIILEILSNDYKHIIVHSMGGFLITKVLHMIKNTTFIRLLVKSKLKRIKFILLNPMLEQLNNIKLLHNIIPRCLSQYIYLPKLFSIPSYKLDNQSNLFSDMVKSDSYSWILYKLVYDSYDCAEFADFDNFIGIYSELGLGKNINIIYSIYDEVVPILPENLNKLQNKFNLYKLNGKHEPFTTSNTKELQENFFKVFNMLVNE